MHKFLQLFSEPIINQVVAIYLTEIDIFLSINQYIYYYKHDKN